MGAIATVICQRQILRRMGTLGELRSISHRDLGLKLLGFLRIVLL